MSRGHAERAAGALLLAVIAVGLAGPWLPYDPASGALASRASLPPGAEHWLGTDHLGRDVAWRVALSAGAFAWPGLLAAMVAVVLGVPAGAVSGYRGGPVEAICRYGFTVVASVPRFVLVLLTAAIYGGSPTVLAIAAGVTYAPMLGEAVYSRIASARRAEFVLGLRAHGVPEGRILLVHLIGATCGRLIARHVVLVFAYVVVLETTLAYIGSYGVQEPTPSFSWGRDNALAWAAPVAALLCVLAACHRTADALGERADG